MSYASEKFDAWKNGDIDTRLDRAKKGMDMMGNKHMSDTLDKMKAGREIGKSFRKNRMKRRVTKVAKGLSGKQKNRAR